MAFIQSNPFVPFVEFYCPHNCPAFLWPLGFNLAVVLLCAVLAFKTRALPENFHDSKCIFASTTCCVFLWMTFVPSVITSESGSTENVLLSFALFVNSSVMLVSLFGLKVSITCSLYVNFCIFKFTHCPVVEQVFALIWRSDADEEVIFYGGTQTIGVQEGRSDVY